jgi:hypothetical protein
VLPGRDEAVLEECPATLRDRGSHGRHAGGESAAVVCLLGLANSIKNSGIN